MYIVQYLILMFTQNPSHSLRSRLAFLLVQCHIDNVLTHCILAKALIFRGGDGDGSTGERTVDIAHFRNINLITIMIRISTRF